MSPSDHLLKGYSQLITYSILVGSVGIAVRFIEGMDVFAIIFFRALIGVLFILLLVVLKGKTRELKPKYFLLTLLVGIIQGLSIVMYFLAILKTSIANAVFLLYTAPIFSLIFARIFFKEKIQGHTWLGLIFAIFGISFVIEPAGFTSFSENMLGNWLALGSGLCYAGMGMLSKSLRQKVSENYVVFWQYLVIAVLLLFFLEPASLKAVSINLPSLLFLGIFCCGLAFLLFMKGIKIVPAQKIFIITALEPLVGMILGMWVFHEIPSVLARLGFIFIILGVLFVTRDQAHAIMPKFLEKLYRLGWGFRILF